MQKIKVSILWSEIQQSVIFNLIKNLSLKEIEIVPVENCDLLIFGPYDVYSLKRRLCNFFFKKIPQIETVFPNIDIYFLNRKIKPIRIFNSFENYPFPSVKYDFAITTHLGINDPNHLRFPLWKEVIDWSHLGIFRNLSADAKRFGSYHNIKELTNLDGNKFINKDKKICFFSGHLNEPRKSLHSKLSENFIVDGYGPYFNKKIKNHNSSNFNKKDIMRNYAFNLCPENSLYPGFYTEKIPEAFLGNCLPLAWADKNIQYDFNKNCFVNLLDYAHDNYNEICYLLKQQDFLKKFNNQPLLIKEPNLDKEIYFIKKILEML
jgi:hypothetical protein